MGVEPCRDSTPPLKGRRPDGLPRSSLPSTTTMPNKSSDDEDPKDRKLREAEEKVREMEAKWMAMRAKMSPEELAAQEKEAKKKKKEEREEF